MQTWVQPHCSPQSLWFAIAIPLLWQSQSHSWGHPSHSPSPGAVTRRLLPQRRSRALPRPDEQGDASIAGEPFPSFPPPGRRPGISPSIQGSAHLPREHRKETLRCRPERLRFPPVRSEPSLKATRIPRDETREQGGWRRVKPVLPGAGKEPGRIPLCFRGPGGGHLSITGKRTPERCRPAEPGPPCKRPAAHRKFLGVFGHSNSAAYF